MFRFNYEKAVQAVAHILRDEPSHRLNYMRLIKLLYMADRESLRETGQPITGDRVFAMDRGPVLSNLYNLIKQEHRRTPEWSRFFRRDHYELVMESDPGNEKLCRYEAEKLTQVQQENQDLDEFDVANKTHTFPEWKQNKPSPGGANPIPAEDILRALGYDSEEIERIRKEARAEHAMARLMGAGEQHDPGCFAP